MPHMGSRGRGAGSSERSSYSRDKDTTSMYTPKRGNGRTARKTWTSYPLDFNFRMNASSILLSCSSFIKLRGFHEFSRELGAGSTATGGELEAGSILVAG